ncbi:MAG TPA: hypothetical protein VHE35_22170, partial [Kofleriaceae bacterium]|nr:hypothetical protein [Kofleriaceae bacterium]
TGQFLGWRVGGAGAAGHHADADASRGGSLDLGYTETLRWLSHTSKLALTVDGEGATGLGVRSGLGLRTRDTSARAVGAAGLALGLSNRIGGLRAHVRALRALTADPGWSNAAEAGIGVATRFDWPGFHGPAPVELWLDLRARRGLGDARDAREREVTTGLDFIPRDGFTRIGLVGIATDERLADGTTGSGRTLMVQLERPFGDL